ncbi:hypothetical protein NUM3379_24160 [Kineococcus sp. NUM-3379]
MGGATGPAGTAAVPWTVRYRNLGEGGAVLREVSASHLWHVLSVPELLEELAAAELPAEVGPAAVVRAVRTG